MLLNRSRAMEAMQQFGLDALIATSPVNIRYFTDYHCWLDGLFKEYMTVPGAPSDLGQAYSVFPAEQEPALVVSALFAVNAADIWVRDLCLFGDPGLEDSLRPGPLSEDDEHLYGLLHPPRRFATSTEAVMSILLARGLVDARIGIEMEGLTRRARETLDGALPRAKLMDCSNLIRWIRMVKSPEEVSLLKRSAEINEVAAMESLALARPGRPMQDLVEHYRARIAAEGADFDHFAFSPRGHGIASEPQYILKKGDVQYTDFGCIYQGYFSDAGTTLALGELPAALQQRYIALQDSIRAGVDAMRPGARASAVQAAMWRGLTARGITASFPHGHGLGLEVRDYPILVPDNGLRIRDDCLDIASDLPLEPNMVLSLEAGLFASGVGSLQIERTLLVTADGSELLVAQDRTRPVQPL